VGLARFRSRLEFQAEILALRRQIIVLRGFASDRPEMRAWNRFFPGFGSCASGPSGARLSSLLAAPGLPPVFDLGVQSR
jgi:hypothetical protein